MKQCSRCGSIQNDSTNFCAKCGSSNFIEVQVRYEEQPNIKTKKKGKKKILGISLSTVAAILIVAIPIGIKTGLRDNYRAQQKKEHSYSLSSNAIDYIGSITEPYSSGDITNGEYINEWANIKFQIPEKFPLYDDYKMYDNENTDTGYASIDIENGKNFALTFYDFTNVIDSFDEEKFLDERISSINEEADDNANLDISDKHNYRIANQDFCTVDIANQDNGIYMRYCVQIKDKRVIEFALISKDEGDIDEFLDSVETVRDK